MFPMSPKKFHDCKRCDLLISAEFAEYDSVGSHRKAEPCGIVFRWRTIEVNRPNIWHSSELGSCSLRATDEKTLFIVVRE